MLTQTQPRRSIVLRPDAYKLKITQQGPKKSPEVVTISGGEYSLGIPDYPLVSRQGEGNWQPIETFEETLSTLKSAADPTQKTEIGTWKDSYKWGLFKDGVIQNNEVTDLWDQKGWDSYAYVESQDGSGHFKSYAQPQEAILVGERYKSATLSVPYSVTRA